MDKEHGERVRRTWRRVESGNTHRFTKNDTKIISNWKTPGYVGIYEFWFKKFTTIHDRLAVNMNRCLQESHVHEWMTKGKTTLIQKDFRNETALNNYRHIMYLPVMWKILMAQIREEIYFSLTSRVLFPDEQRGYCKGSRQGKENNFINSI